MNECSSLSVFRSGPAVQLTKSLLFLLLLIIPAGILQEVLAAKAKMEHGLGLFSEVGVEVNITDDPTDETNEGLDVTLKVKEPRRFTGGVHTLVGNNDGSLMVSFKVAVII